MPFDSMGGGSGGHSGPWCTACSLPIADGEPVERIHFPQDPHGHEGLSGPYHQRCAKPFSSLARVCNLNIWGRF